MDSRSGRLDLDSRDAGLDWPAVFADTLDLDELSGRLTWLRVAGGLRMVSDQVVLSTPDGHMRSTFELTWPDGDALPTVALESQIRDLDVAAAKRYFPLGLFPQVIGYLDRAILGGRVPQVDISLVGPLASFPFDKHEGRFSARAQVQDGSMAYVADWPVAEVLNGELSFTNAGWEAVGSGRVFGNLSENLRVGIEDVRNPVLNVAATTRGPLQDVLRFLRESPLLARHLGPDLELLQSDAGTAEVTFELDLPLLQRSAYRLGAGLEISGGVLSIDGFGPTVTDIDGGLRLDEAGGVSGSGIRASFLDAPVMLKVEAAGEPGYLADIAFEGAIEADAIQAAFNLPFVEQVLGRAWWRGRVSLPENRVIQARREPLRIGLESDLAGVDLRFPEPLEKPSQQNAQLEMEFVFVEADRLNVNGQLGEDRRFALSLRNREGDLSFRRGAIRFGGAVPLLPPRNGLSISGELESAGLDAWWELLRRQAAGGAAAGVLLGANLEIEDFSALGQRLGPAEVSLRQQAARWHLQIDSEPVAGEITWPLDLSDRPQVLADMARLYISTERISSGDGPDPRLLPGIRLHADDFVVGNWRFGALDADIEADPEGLNVASFTGRSESFFMEGSGGWYQRPQGQETRVVLAASSENVAGALEQLGFDAITEAERAQLALNVYWPSAPSPGWEESITGGLNLRLERGSVLNLDPGAGRMVGLMSITALPRRLALDFRDVFNRGLVFDEMSGDFVIIDGNAYTDNLHLTGPVVDIGVVGTNRVARPRLPAARGGDIGAGADIAGGRVSRQSAGGRRPAALQRDLQGAAQRRHPRLLLRYRKLVGAAGGAANARTTGAEQALRRPAAVGGAGGAVAAIVAMMPDPIIAPARNEVQPESQIRAARARRFDRPATSGANALAVDPQALPEQDALAVVGAQLLEPAGLELTDIDRALGALMSRQLDYADIYLQYTRFESWTVDDGIVRDGVHSVDHGMGIRALDGERTGFAYSDELGKAALDDAVRAARGIARHNGCRALQGRNRDRPETALSGPGSPGKPG